MPDIDDYPVLTGDAASDDYVLGFDVSDHSTSLDGRTKLFPVESLPTGVQVAGDIGGTVSAPKVTGTHLSEPLPVGQGGTGESSLGALGTAMGLGSAALQPTSAFDASGAAASAQATAETYAAGLVSTETTRAEAAEALLLPKSGGTMSGPLVISDTPGASPSVLPAGYADSAALTGLQVASSYPSDDVTGGTDGTGRISLYSYQRANTNSFGETIRNFLMRWDAKAMTAWYGPTGGSSGGLTASYDGSGNPVTGSGWRPWAWTGAHYEANDHNSVHGHWEIEVPDTTGALQGRFIVPFADTNPTSPTYGQIGLTKTNIRLSQADFSVDAAWGVLRVGGSPGVNDRILEFSNDVLYGSAGAVRWRVVGNNTAETGSNAGSDFAIRRFDDFGNMLGTALFVQRSDGQMVSGAAGPENARLALVWSNTGQHGFSARPSSSPGTGAAFDAQMTAPTDIAVQADITGDTTRRWTVQSGGTMSWGPGNAATDTNLYRASSGLLKTDYSFTAAGTVKALTSLGVGVSGSLTGVFDVEASAAGQLAMFRRTSTSDSTPMVTFLAGDTSTAQAIGISVSGDTTNRFGVDPTGKITWGSGSASRDTDLYRSAAGVLTTDGTLAVGANLSVTGLALGTPGPSASGYLAWTADPLVAPTSASTGTAKTLYLNALYVAAAATTTKVYFVITTGATGVTSGNNWIGLFSSSGTVVASAAIDSVITGTGLQTVSWSSSALLTPGLYWVGFVANATGMPQLERTSNAFATAANGNVPASAFRTCSNGTNVTALSAVTPSSNSQSATQAYWHAIS